MILSVLDTRYIMQRWDYSDFLSDYINIVTADVLALLLNEASRGGHFKNTYELVNLGAHEISFTNKLHIFQCMGKIFCVEFQRKSLKFHTKYLTHTLKEKIFIQCRKFKTS